jgi:hypothetical protein
MSSLVGNAEAISQQISQDAAFGCVLTLGIIGLIFLSLLFLTLRHRAQNMPVI